MKQYDPYAKFEKITLKNGLRVFHSKINRSFLKVGFVIHSGANADPKNLPGLAHFTEHLVCESNEKYSMKSILEFIKLNGGQAMLGATSWDDTIYSFEIPSKNKLITETFKIFCNILGDGSINKHIERERSAILSEYMQKFSSSDDYQDILHVRKHIFKNHPAGNFVRPLGTLESIQNITQENLEQFYQQHYVAKNMTIVSCGDMTTSELLEYLERSSFTQKKSSSLFKCRNFDTALKTKHHIHTELEPKTTKRLEQFRYARLNGISGHLCSQKVKIFTNILNEILFDTMRHKKNLVYSFNAGYMKTANFYEFHISGTVKDVGKSIISGLVEKSLKKVVGSKQSFIKHKKIRMLEMQIIDPSYTDIIKDSMEDVTQQGYIESISNIKKRIHNVSFDDMKVIYDILTTGNIYTLIQN